MPSHRHNAGGRQAGRQVGRLRLELWAAIAAMPPGERTQHSQWRSSSEMSRAFCSGGRASCVRQYDKYDTRGLPVEPLADVTTIDTLQTPTARILHTKEAFRSRTLPTPHHSLRLSLLISSEPGGSTDICQQQRSTAVGTYMKSQTRASSRRHPLGPRCCTLVIAEWI